MVALKVPAPWSGKTTQSWLFALIVLVGMGAMPGPARSFPAGYDLIPTPGVIGPIANEDFSSATNNYTFYATDVALASYGYIEEEFYMKGLANAYNAPSSAPAATPPTTLASIVTPHVPYKTRIVVRRPTDPSKFNGTVVVEWFNVTDNFDGEYFWLQAQQYLVRAGYAYIGVSAQDVGISNPTTGLKVFSPTRYGILDVNLRGSSCCTADRLSYDIFSQVAKAAYAVPRVLNGLTVKNTIGVGMSQSGTRMGAYADYIHMLAPIYDALIMQVATGAIRNDLNLPLIKVLSETESSTGNLNNDQPDTFYRKTYWVAGSNHGDETQRLGRTSVKLRDLGPQNTANDSCGTVTATQPYGDTPTRTRTPFRHVLNAAVFYLKRQIEQGVQAPSAPRFTRTSTASNAPVLRDSFGNSVGGIRLAHSEVPTARANGTLCGNIGAWVPFSTAQLQALYPTHNDYVSKVTAAVNASVAAGFVLPEDAAETIGEATASVIGTGLECGPLCLSAWHWRPGGTTTPQGTQATPFSSTGLLRDNTVYYNIKNGGDLIASIDAAHNATAVGYSTTGAAAAASFAQAAAALRRYLELLQSAEADGRVTATAAVVLSLQAQTIIAGLLAL